MTKTNVPTNDIGDIPAALRRTNDKGVTLVDTSATATGTKPSSTMTTSDLRAKEKADKAAAKALAKEAADKAKAAKQAEREAARAAKEEAKRLEAVAKSGTLVTDQPAVGADGQPLEKVKRSIVPAKFKDRYKAHGGTCGDDMALELKAATTTRNSDKREVLDIDALRAIAGANGIDFAKYETMNNGQKRMNVGNKLRGLLKAGKDVVVGTRVFKAEDMPA
jgi:hypothetical protein